MQKNYKMTAMTLFCRIFGKKSKKIKDEINCIMQPCGRNFNVIRDVFMREDRVWQNGNR